MSNLHFKVDTVSLLHEIADNALRPSMGVLKVPLNVLRTLLAEVAQRCTVLYDPILNRIMVDMHLYELPKPTTQEYRKIYHAVIKREKEYLKLQKAKKNALP
jgi:hypothetical protein